MRKITFGGASSLDNFIARPDGAVDWLMWSDEVAQVTGGYLKNVDTILMGRKTYEIALAMTGGKKKRKSKSQKKSSGNIKTYVFSRTLKKEDHEDVEIISEKAVEFVETLKRQPGADICLMGGGDLAKTFFEAGLIDEVGFNIHPVLLGQGVPLFHKMTRQINLELIECKTFKNGCILVKYLVKKD